MQDHWPPTGARALDNNNISQRERERSKWNSLSCFIINLERSQNIKHENKPIKTLKTFPKFEKSPIILLPLLIPPNLFHSLCYFSTHKKFNMTSTIIFWTWKNSFAKILFMRCFKCGLLWLCPLVILGFSLHVIDYWLLFG